MPRPRAAADIYQAVADPTRRAILDRLRGGPAAVNDLAAAFTQSRPAISKHLRVLKDSHLVTEDKVGRERLYRLHPERLQEIAGWLEGYRSFWQTSLARLKEHLEQQP